MTAVLPPSVRWIILDAVGTVIRPHPPVAEAYHQIGARHGSRLTPEQVAANFRAAFARTEQEDVAGNLATSEARELRRWEQIVAESLPDIETRGACFDELHAHFGEPAAWRCFDDVAASLERFRSAGRSIALASNFDARLHRVQAGLVELQAVQRVVVSSEVGARKPSPEFFLQLCRQLACPPGQALMIGDDWDNDVAPARAAGLHALWLRRAGGAPDRESVSTLAEVRLAGL